MSQDDDVMARASEAARNVLMKEGYCVHALMLCASGHAAKEEPVRPLVIAAGFENVDIFKMMVENLQSFAATRMSPEEMEQVASGNPSMLQLRQMEDPLGPDPTLH